MRSIQLMGACALAMTMSGCATTSFAPPMVIGKVTGSNSTSCSARARQTVVNVSENVDGARTLIDSFIDAYRCSAQGAANGRQAFEVPVILTTAGVVLATAFGAGPDVAIAGGGASAILTTGKNYYAPQRKAEIYAQALNAIVCISSEAAGITAPSLTAKAAEAQATIQAAGGGSVTLPVQKQYYTLVASHLYSVENVARTRLSATGTYDAEGVAAQIKELQKKIEDAEKAKQDAAKKAEDAAKDAKTDEAQAATAKKAEADEKAKPAGDRGPPATIAGLSASAAAFEAKAKQSKAAEGSAKAEAVTLEIEAIRPKLQQCVVLAKG